MKFSEVYLINDSYQVYLRNTTYCGLLPLSPLLKLEFSKKQSHLPKFKNSVILLESKEYSVVFFPGMKLSKVFMFLSIGGSILQNQALIKLLQRSIAFPGKEELERKRKTLRNDSLVV